LPPEGHSVYLVTFFGYICATTFFIPL
jgi:hypothetical protein